MCRRSLIEQNERYQTNSEHSLCATFLTKTLSLHYILIGNNVRKWMVCSSMGEQTQTGWGLQLYFCSGNLRKFYLLDSWAPTLVPSPHSFPPPVFEVGKQKMSGSSHFFYQTASPIPVSLLKSMFRQMQVQTE